MAQHFNEMDPGDYEAFRINAESGDMESQYVVGHCLFYGKGGVAINKEEAFQWFEQAAALGSGKAAWRVAYCYHYGWGVARDKDSSQQWFSEAIPKLKQESESDEDAESQYWLGFSHLCAYGVEQNQTLASRWFEKAAEQEHAMAQFRLAQSFICGWGIDTDGVQACFWFCKAAKNGKEHSRLDDFIMVHVVPHEQKTSDQKVLAVLAYCYERGKAGKEQDLEHAARLRQKSRTVIFGMFRRRTLSHSSLLSHCKALCLGLLIVFAGIVSLYQLERTDAVAGNINILFRYDVDEKCALLVETKLLGTFVNLLAQGGCLNISVPHAQAENGTRHDILDKFLENGSLSEFCTKDMFRNQQQWVDVVHITPGAEQDSVTGNGLSAVDRMTLVGLEVEEAVVKHPEKRGTLLEESPSKSNGQGQAQEREEEGKTGQLPFNAMEKDESSFFPALLTSIRLSQHEKLFVENGIETAQDLRDLTREEAKEIGITTVGELNRIRRWQNVHSSD